MQFAKIFENPNKTWNEENEFFKMFSVILAGFTWDASFHFRQAILKKFQPRVFLMLEQVKGKRRSGTYESRYEILEGVKQEMTMM